MQACWPGPTQPPPRALGTAGWKGKRVCVVMPVSSSTWQLSWRAEGGRSSCWRLQSGEQAHLDFDRHLAAVVQARAVHLRQTGM